MPHNLIDELAMFYKHFSQDESANRFLGSEFIAKLASLNFGKYDRLPLLQNAIWKAQLTSSGSKIVGGVCKLVPLSALSSLTSAAARDKTKAAEKVMSMAREVVKQVDIPADKSSTIIGNLDIRVALNMCKLVKYMDKPLDKLEDIPKALASTRLVDS